MASVAVDGVALDRIIKRVNFDITELKRRADEATGVEFSDELIENIAAKVIASLDQVRKYTPTESFEREKVATERQLQQLTDDCNTRFEKLERSLRQSFESKIAEMKEGYDKALSVVNSTLSEHQDALRDQARQLAEASARIDGVEERMVALRKDLLKRHNHLHQELISIMDCKVNDTFHLVDARLNKLDADVHTIINRHTEALASFDEKMIDTTDRLFAIENTYCMQADLVLKADAISLSSKADASDLLAVKELADGTMRALDMLRQATKDAQLGLENSLTERTDKKAEWILRTLRKELREKDSTDIGKVRCLVCDQPVPQKETVDTSVFGGDPLKPSQQHLHAQGKTRELIDSGNFEEAENKDVAGEGRATYRRTAPRSRPTSATEAPSYQYNRKLVSLSAAPTNNILTAILREQQQRLSEVFEDENSVFSSEAQMRRMQTPVRQSYPPPSNQVGSGTNAVRAQSARGARGEALPAGSLSSSYFQELENKFSHTSGGRTNPLLAAKQRPGSAPAWKNRKR